MTGEINSNALAQLMEMGLPHGDAVECLKACGNDVSRAVEYFFNRDSEKPQNNQWDQNAWRTSRDDATEHDYNNWNSSFLVQGADQLLPEATNGNRYDGTKSRPPSPTNADAEDPELAEAMRLSMQGSPQQETGITTRGRSPVQLPPLNPNFNQAHANKEYNPQDWALTTTTVKPIAAEALPDDRKRSPNTPAFLRSTHDNYNLGGALTILHSIPRMRDLFLMRDYLQVDYGSNEKWWNGERIQISRVIDLENIRTDNALEVINEVQRLFAFLDGTERAYGSVEPLCDMPNIRETNRLQQLATFMRNYEVAYRYISIDENVNLPSITSTGRLFDDGVENKERASSFQLLEISVNANDSSIYSAIDSLIWDEEEVAIDFNDVVIFSIQQASGSPGTGVEIPTEIYLDRYTEPWLEQVADLKKNIRHLRNKREAIIKRALGLTQFHGENPVEFLTETIRIYSEIILNQEFNILDDENTVPTENPIPSLEKILNNLKTNIASIDAKHAEVAAQLNELHATYTTPTTCPAGAPPLRRHILRGITTGDSHTYLLRPREGDKPEWWSFTWNPNGDTWDPKPTHSTIPMTQAAVLQAAQTQGESVTLFYAVEEAMIGDKSLPQKLQEFVDRDNELFRKEMDPPPVYNMEEVRIDDEPVSPTGSGERKRTRDDRDDSFSSNNGVVKRLSFSDEVEMIEKPGEKEVVKAMLKDQDDKEMIDIEHVEEVRKGG